MSALRTVRQLTKLRPARPTVGAPEPVAYILGVWLPADLRLSFCTSSDDARVKTARIVRGGGPAGRRASQPHAPGPHGFPLGGRVGETPANDEVFLTRKYGDENIHVMFSIADLQSIPDEDEPEPEATDNEGPTRGDEPARLGGDYEVTETKLICICALQPTHPGALHADLYCTDGAFDVANVAYYKDARVATELSIASDWERRTLWTGPLMDSG
ncbi:hypothetical protein DFH08DRAFT_823778 [Mycena albidolilacea]|uniref:Uncharacterized protein n=1 Tax=Mycena albidolilacea TaxID=1033008 RepID=A0AAD6Z5K4_9AGAR|nr:hypothetical protein DFH08DRAFT_823778 [Mycena albidolilacea]